MANARTFPTIEDAKAAYPEYVPFESGPTQTGAPTQFYKPFEGQEPWDCACVAIWTLSDGRAVAEEY